jgi:hypothetical protein
MIGTTSAGISDQLRDIHSIYRCCWNVATYLNGKFTMGKLKSSFQYILEVSVSLLARIQINNFSKNMSNRTVDTC